MRKMVLFFCLCLAATSVYAKGSEVIIPNSFDITDFIISVPDQIKAKWVVDKHTGCQVLIRTYSQAEVSISWSGDKCDKEPGKANGKGDLLVKENGKLSYTLQGIMKNGLCRAECLVTKADGKEYRGEFNKIVPNNRGMIVDMKTGCQALTRTYSQAEVSIAWSGDKCTKNNGRVTGKGSVSVKENGKFSYTLEGIMKDGLCQSECLITKADGSRYSGALKWNIPYGEGVKISANGDKQIGKWKNGILITGKIMSDNTMSKKYIGDIKNRKQHGKGAIFYGNGDKYSGSWSEGKRHGKGTYTFKDGTSYEGLWEKGERIKVF